jgi:hypothetical protein
MCLASLISRKEAINKGLPKYFTGKPCKYGHTAERRVSNWNCVICETEKARKAYAKDPTNYLQAQKKWYAKTLEYQKHRAKTYRLQNADKVKQYMQNWRKENAETEKIKKKQWVEQNRGAKNASLMRRHAAKMQRMPNWLTDDDHWLIKEIYDLAVLRSTMTGIKWHVDHIVPLQGRTVSGLHVPWNLQVIPAVENISKGNRFDER